MFDPALRQTLRSLQEMLAELQTSVPLQAREFHRRRAELSTEVARMLGLWWWTSTNRAHDLSRDVQHLAALAGPLHRLFEAATELQRRIGGLRTAAEASQALAARVAARCVEWSAEVSRLGATAGRLDDVEADQVTLAGLSADVHESDDMVRLLVEAERLNTAFAGDVQAAGLNADLSGWQTQFIEGGPTVELRQKLNSQLDPLRQRARDEPAVPLGPPPGTFEIRGILSELFQWARSLGDDDHDTMPIERLDEQVAILEGQAEERDPSKFDALHHEAQELRARYVQEARRRRDEGCGQIEETYRLYRRACAEDARLSASIERLRAQKIDAPANYADWGDAFAEVSNRLLAEAGQRRPSLIGALKAALAALDERIENVRGQLLTRARRADLEVLAANADLRRVPVTLDDTLAGLRTCERAERKLGELEREAGHERQAVTEQANALKRRIDALQASAKAIQLTVHDLSDELAGVPASPDALDVSTDLVNGIERRLESEESRFVAACREMVAADEAFVTRACAALGRIRPGLAPSIPEPPTVPRSPLEAAAAVQAARARHEVLAGLFDGEHARLDTELTALASKLDALAASPGETRSEDLATARLLRAEIAAPTETRDLVPRVDALAAVADRVTAFFAHLEKDELETKDTLAGLDAKLRQFTADGLRDYFPEAADRVAALLAGVEIASGQWSVVRAQLAEAERVLRLLDAHSRRLAALDVEDSLAVAERVKSSRDATIAAQARRLLDALEPYSHGALLPPSGLRDDLRQLARRSEQVEHD